MTARGPYELAITRTARRQLSEQLPEAVAAAAYEFIVGPLLDNPRRVGKRLQPPLADRHSARRGTYRVIYRIDDARRIVTVVDVAPRRDAYRAERSARRPGRAHRPVDAESWIGDVARSGPGQRFARRAR